MQRITVYRSVSENELLSLVTGAPLFGRYKCNEELQNSSGLCGVVCTFAEPLAWFDRTHSVCLEISTPENEVLARGTGVYYAAKTLAETRVWNGHRGAKRYEIPEVYLRRYSVRCIQRVSFAEPESNFAETIIPMLLDFGIQVVPVNKLLFGAEQDLERLA